MYRKTTIARNDAPAVRAFTLATMLVAVLTALLLISLTAGASEGGAATLLKGSFRGNAYATFANAEAGPVATQLGRSAFQPCPCNGTGGRTLSNTVDTVSTEPDGRTLTAEGTLATVFTNKTASSARVTNTAKVTGLNALDGLITADAIRAVANTSANSRTINSTSTGSTFLNLRIAGRPISTNVAANTRVELPGLGYVLLKSVQKSGDGRRVSTITVDMVTIVVNRNNDFDLPIGSRIVIAHAVSGFTRSEPEVIVGGQAFAAEALVTTDAVKNRVGKAAFIAMGCEGTQGRTRTNNVNLLDVGDVLSAGTGTTTAFGGPTATGTVAQTTATVEDLSLLDGLISANVIKAVARDTFSNGTRTSSTRGSQFGGLNIAGTPVPVDVAPNTRINLPGIGYVIVNEQKIPSPTSTDRLRVNGLKVFITRNNTLGLPIGTQIVVAHADSTAVAFRN